MEKTIIFFVCDALISSEYQINIHDRLYNENDRSNLGSCVKTVAEKVKNALICHEIHLESFTLLMKDLISIFEKYDDVISNLLKLFFEKACVCHERSFENLKDSNSYSPTDISSPNAKYHSYNDIVIEIDDNSNDSNPENVLVHEDIFSSTKDWVKFLKIVFHELSIELKSLPFLQNSTRNSNIFYGFFETFNFGLNSLDMNSNIVQLTTVFEELSISSIQGFQSKNKNVLFNNKGLQNPIIQVITTSFRSIIEAYKISFKS